MPRRLTVTRDREPGDSDAALAVSPFEMLSVLIRRRRMIAYSVLGAVALTVGITLVIPNKYVSTASILPSGQMDKMADLKSLAGLSGLVAQDENSSELFPVILSSQTIKDAVLAAKYSFTGLDREYRMSLPEYFDQDDPDKLRDDLSDITAVHQDKKTGVITVEIETEYPAFSQAILSQYISQLETFNLHKRRSQAGERAKYLERELAQCKTDLTAAEDSLATFQAANRDWMSASDPELSVLIARLERDVQTRNQTFLYLLQEYEIAKLDARKDVPVVRILDAPSLPTQKSSPKRAVIVVLAALAALIGSVFGILLLEALRRNSDGPGGNALETLRTDISREFPRVNRVLNRVFQTSAK